MKTLFILLLGMGITCSYAQSTSSKTYSNHTGSRPQNITTNTRSSYTSSKPERPEHSTSYPQPSTRSYRPEGHTSPITKSTSVYAQQPIAVKQVGLNGEPVTDEYDNFAYPEKGCMLISIEELKDPKSNRHHLLKKMPERFCLFTSGGHTFSYLSLHYYLLTVVMFPRGYGEYPEHAFPVQD